MSIIQLISFFLILCSLSTSETKSSKKDDEPGNPIGELQEFTQKKLLKPPIYEFVTEQGPPHAREFICNIKLGKFADKGKLYE